MTNIILFYVILNSLLIAHMYESSEIIMNDICLKSNSEKKSFNYTFIYSIPKGGLNSGIHTQYENMDGETCYKKCCEEKMCNIAWNLKNLCITFQCDLKEFDKCMPIPSTKDNLSTPTLFLLRYPREKKSLSATTVSKATPEVSVKSLLTTSSTTNIKILKVVVSKNQTITMPVNSVTLSADVPGDKGSTFEYQWSLISKPSDLNSGKMDTTKNKLLKLTELIVGEYQFQVEVRGNNSYGKAIVSVFVKPAEKLNQPPNAKIEPNYQVVQLPNNVILDGTKSTDDDKVVSYYWELIKGPLDVGKKIKNDQSMLNLENLVAGNYTFKLTVKDVTGAFSSDTAYLTVLAEKDYPPQADPGHNIIVELPVKFVILNGTGSRDDKKIVSYEWTKKSDGLTADIQGVREPILNLTNLQEGTYTFNLKVTDSSGQSSDKDVQVFVKPRTNSKPTAKASVTDDKSVTVRLPATEAVLNGSLSTDDDKITKYLWKQIEGLPKLNLVDFDKAVAYVYDLKIGVFKFNLTVYDKENLASSDVVTLRINESKNQNPKAKIDNVPEYYHLENNLLKVDGSKSWDDVKIVQYKWTREDDSLAVGEVLENSDSSPILMLTDLVPGQYKFKLEVFDEEGLFDNLVKSFDVLPSKHEKNLVELQFLCSLNLLTESKKNAFLNNIQLIAQKRLNSDTSKVVVHLMQLDRNHFKNSVSIIFYVTLNKRSQSTSTTLDNVPMKVKSRSTNSEDISFVEEIFVDALTIVEALSAVRHNYLSMEYQIVRVDTYVCQNNCSNHGKCDDMTKICLCDAFWTSNWFRERYGDGRPNCDWSVIYLIIFSGMLIFFLIMFCCILLVVKQRKCRTKKSTKNRKHKYMKINEYDYENRINNTSKVPKSLSNGVKARITSEKATDSLLNSDSSLSSDESTSFVNPNHYRDDHSPIKKSSSFSSIPMCNGNPLKTL